mmetsp:Transcript_11845/g.16055  ORF Transcript_11845/g.16055 Transcript_11845/m.16055 type:complete len:219 (+) Transcript_11845:205-861(+)
MAYLLLSSVIARSRVCAGESKIESGLVRKFCSPTRITSTQESKETISSLSSLTKGTSQRLTATKALTWPSASSRLLQTRPTENITSFVEITSEDQFDAILDNTDKDTLVVVDFYARWCRGCSALMPMLEKLSTRWQHIKWVKVDADVNHSLLQKLRVDTFPRIQMYRNQEFVVEFVPSPRAPHRLKSSIQMVDKYPNSRFMVHGGQVCTTPLEPSILI